MSQEVSEFPLYDSLVRIVRETNYCHEPLDMSYQLNQLGNQGNSQFQTMRNIIFIIYHHARLKGITLDASKLPYGGTSGKGGIGVIFKTQRNSAQKNVLPPELCNIIGKYLQLHFYEEKDKE